MIDNEKVAALHRLGGWRKLGYGSGERSRRGRRGGGVIAELTRGVQLLMLLGTVRMACDWDPERCYLVAGSIRRQSLRSGGRLGGGVRRIHGVCRVGHEGGIQSSLLVVRIELRTRGAMAGRRQRLILIGRGTVRVVTAVDGVGVEGGRKGVLLLVLLPRRAGPGHVLGRWLLLRLLSLIIVPGGGGRGVVGLAIMRRSRGLEQVIMVAIELLARLVVFIEVHVIGRHLDQIGPEEASVGDEDGAPIGASLSLQDAQDTLPKAGQF